VKTYKCGKGNFLLQGFEFIQKEFTELLGEEIETRHTRMFDLQLVLHCRFALFRWETNEALNTEFEEFLLKGGMTISDCGRVKIKIE